jgi:hypothetical protein
VPEHLPGASEMTDYEHAMVLLGQASAALAALGSVLGPELPGLDAIQAALNRPEHHRDDVRREILSSYLAIQQVLLGPTRWPEPATGRAVDRNLPDGLRPSLRPDQGRRKHVPRRGFMAAGPVQLPRAKATGQLRFDGAQLGADTEGIALPAERVKVGGNLYLDANFTAKGAARLDGAEIVGDLYCGGAQLGRRPDCWLRMEAHQR